MNYPVWDIFMGGSMLIAIIAVTHIFVSHFAVGGGFFLVLTELKAYREDDSALRDYVKRHSKFFILLTLVFGAVGGVGIWFTIGLIHPEGTSALIHAYVWGWATEWVFFFLEITAAFLYFYTWERFDRKTHLTIGWIYFISAWASMFIIAGIITFMLTPGKWIETHNFWHGFFNPTYFPTIIIRTCVAAALAGLYALLTSSLLKDLKLKEKLVRYSSKWIIISFLFMALGALWFMTQIPESASLATKGAIPTAHTAAVWGVVLSVILFLLAILWPFLAPKKFPVAGAVLFMVLGLAATAAGEFYREAVRKPFIIYDYMYSNSILNDQNIIDEINRDGLLAHSKWALNKDLTAEDLVPVGREVFRMQCQSCHTINGYRGIKGLAKGWDVPQAVAMLARLDKMRGNMPPYFGIEAERVALANFIVSLQGAPTEKPVELDGAAVFERRCGSCHTIDGPNPINEKVEGFGEEGLIELISGLQDLAGNMPPFTGTEEEKAELANWLSQLDQ